MKKHWLYLEPFTFIWNQTRSVYIYNSLSGIGFNFFHTSETLGIAQKLSDIDNLYCIELEEHLLANASVNKFITNIQYIIAGNMLYCKPVILPPMLNLQTDIERLRKDESRSSGESSLNYLHQLNILISTNYEPDEKWYKLKKFINSIADPGLLRLRNFFENKIHP